MPKHYAFEGDLPNAIKRDLADPTQPFEFRRVRELYKNHQGETIDLVSQMGGKSRDESRLKYINEFLGMYITELLLAPIEKRITKLLHENNGQITAEIVKEQGQAIKLINENKTLTFSEILGRLTEEQIERYIRKEIKLLRAKQLSNLASTAKERFVLDGLDTFLPQVEKKLREGGVSTFPALPQHGAVADFTGVLEYKSNVATAVQSNLQGLESELRAQTAALTKASQDKEILLSALSNEQREVASLGNELTTAKATIESQRLQLLLRERELAKMLADTSRDKKNDEALTRELEVLRGRKQTSDERVSALELQKTVLEQTISELRNQSKHTDDSFNVRKKRIDDLKAQHKKALEAMESRAKKAETDTRELAIKLSTAKEQADVAQLKLSSSITALQKQLKTQGADQSKIEQDIKRKTQELDDAKKTSEKLKEELVQTTTKLKADIETVKASSDKIEHERKEAVALSQQLQKDRDAEVQAKTELTKQLASVQTQAAQTESALKIEVAKKESEISSIRIQLADLQRSGRVEDQAEIKRLRFQIEIRETELQGTIAVLRDAEKNLKELNAQLLTENRALKVALEQSNVQRETLTKELADERIRTQTAIKLVEETRGELEKTRNDAKREIDALNANLAAKQKELQDLEASKKRGDKIHEKSIESATRDISRLLEQIEKSTQLVKDQSVEIERQSRQIKILTTESSGWKSKYEAEKQRADEVQQFATDTINKLIAANRQLVTNQKQLTEHYEKRLAAAKTLEDSLSQSKGALEKRQTELEAEVLSLRNQGRDFSKVNEDLKSVKAELQLQIVSLQKAQQETLAANAQLKEENGALRSALQEAQKQRDEYLAQLRKTTEERDAAIKQNEAVVRNLGEAQKKSAENERKLREELDKLSKEGGVLSAEYTKKLEEHREENAQLIKLAQELQATNSSLKTERDQLEKAKNDLAVQLVSLQSKTTEDARIAKELQEKTQHEKDKAEAEVTRLTGALKKQTEGVEKVTAELHKAQEEKKAVEASGQAITQDLQKRLAALETQQRTLNQEKERLAGRLSASESQVKDLTAQNAVQVNTIKSLEGDLKTLQGEQDKLKQELKETREKHTRELADQKTKYESELLKKSIEAAKQVADLEATRAQITQLQDQASRLTGKTEQDAAQLAALGKQIAQAQSQLKGSEAQIRDLEKEKRELTARVQQVEADRRTQEEAHRKALEAQKQAFDQVVSAKDAALAQQASTIVAIESRLKETDDQVKKLSENKSQNEVSIARLEGESKDLRETLAAARNTINELTADKKTLESQVLQIKKESEERERALLKTIDEQKQTFDRTLSDANKQIADKTVELESKKRQEEQLTDRISGLEKTLSEKDAELTNRKTALDAAIAKGDAEAQRALATLNNERAQWQKEKLALEGSLKDTRGQLVQTQQQLAQAVSAIGGLRAEVTQLTARIGDLERDKNEWEARARKAEHDKTVLTQQLAQQAQEAAAKQAAMQGEIDSAKKNIDGLRAQIKGLEGNKQEQAALQTQLEQAQRELSEKLSKEAAARVQAETLNARLQQENNSLKEIKARLETELQREKTRAQQLVDRNASLVNELTASRQQAEKTNKDLSDKVLAGQQEISRLTATIADQGRTVEEQKKAQALLEQASSNLKKDLAQQSEARARGDALNLQLQAANKQLEEANVGLKEALEKSESRAKQLEAEKSDLTRQLEQNSAKAKADVESYTSKIAASTAEVDRLSQALIKAGTDEKAQRDIKTQLELRNQELTRQQTDQRAAQARADALNNQLKLENAALIEAKKRVEEAKTAVESKLHEETERARKAETDNQCLTQSLTEAQTKAAKEQAEAATKVQAAKAEVDRLTTEGEKSGKEIAGLKQAQEALERERTAEKAAREQAQNLNAQLQAANDQLKASHEQVKALLSAQTERAAQIEAENKRLTDSLKAAQDKAAADGAEATRRVQEARAKITKLEGAGTKSQQEIDALKKAKEALEKERTAEAAAKAQAQTLSTELTAANKQLQAAHLQTEQALRDQVQRAEALAIKEREAQRMAEKAKFDAFAMQERLAMEAKKREEHEKTITELNRKLAQHKEETEKREEERLLEEQARLNAEIDSSIATEMRAIQEFYKEIDAQIVAEKEALDKFSKEVHGQPIIHAFAAQLREKRQEKLKVEGPRHTGGGKDVHHP